MAKSSIEKFQSLQLLVLGKPRNFGRASSRLIGQSRLTNRVFSDNIYCTLYWNFFSRYLYTTSSPEKLCCEGSSKAILSTKLESALKDHNVDEAWDTYKDFKRLYGFPDLSLVRGLITKMSYSSDYKWIRKGSNLVLSISEEKPELLNPELLTKVTLSLARAQIPVMASKILRLILEKSILLSNDTLGLIFLHLVKTETGSILASNILIEICSASRKSNTLIFNLVLDACVRFGSCFKGQEIIELMARIGVIADAHTIVIISQIHEINCTRNELKKFKPHIDEFFWVSDSTNLASHYSKFYDSLMSLHFKFNDIDSVSALISDIYTHRETKRDPQKLRLVSIGSDHLRAGLRLQISPNILSKDCIFASKQELVIYKNRKLVLSNKTLAKLIIGFKKYRRINELAKLLVSIYKSDQSECNNICFDVVNSCIHFGWLETAHDLLDDFKFQGNMYKSLLNAYYDKGMIKEANTLLKQLKETGLVESLDSELVFSSEVSNLTESLGREIEEEKKMLNSHMVNELNSSIYYFMKAKMIDDAIKTYRKMQEMNIQPTITTFFHLVSGYSSLEMYRDITILWGDIKRNTENGNVIINRDLYELLLLNFLRGGYFERVMEIISIMKENEMYLDKWMYKKVYLKFHKDLYRKLKVSHARNEVQSQRIEYVGAFRDWVGIS